MSREVELGCESCPCDSARAGWSHKDNFCSPAVETAVAQGTSRCAMARGHRLNTSIVLAAVHGLFGVFRAVSAVEPSHFLPPPLPVPVPNKPHRFCGRKVKCTSQQGTSDGLLARFVAVPTFAVGKTPHSDMSSIKIGGSH